MEWKKRIKDNLRASDPAFPSDATLNKHSKIPGYWEAYLKDMIFEDNEESFEKFRTRIAVTNLRSNALEFYRWVFDNKDFVLEKSHNELSNVLCERMQVAIGDNASRFEPFQARYFTCREGKHENDLANGRKIITGLVELKFRGQAPWFYHKSRQMNDSGNQDHYDHDGPVISLKDRLYLIGVGNQWIRQWTIRAVRDTGSQEIPGIVLTEKAELNEDEIPMAGKTVMLSELYLRNKCPKLDWVDLPKLVDGSIFDQIERYFNNTAEVKSGLYGWMPNED